MKRQPLPAIRVSALTLSVALALPVLGLWAEETSDRARDASPGAVQTPAAPDAAPTDPAPTPDPVTPDPVPPVQEPAPTPDQPPVQDQPPAPAQPPAEPIAPDAAPPPAEPPVAPAVPDRTPPAGATATELSPMRQFVSQNVHEVGMLSRQIDHFQSAGRRDVVRVLQHMIRDHVLVSDAGQNVLARQRQASNPVIMPMPEMPASSEEMIRHDIQEHERMLGQTQQLLANATNEAERSVYGQSVNATRKHLTWLRNLDQGQRVQVGYFGPTMPLARIAGFREETRAGQGAGKSRSAAPRRASRRSGTRGTGR